MIFVAAAHLVTDDLVDPPGRVLEYPDTCPAQRHHSADQDHDKRRLDRIPRAEFIEQETGSDPEHGNKDIGERRRASAP
ncbi:hypothetical protein [Amycolatopsis sp. NPDC051071]|uniref:hypothetical protein n=1 Tax=Amycolatopsis sp. NPDC051071 TaxID=3154637 RepID=UPI0034428335